MGKGLTLIPQLPGLGIGFIRLGLAAQSLKSITFIHPGQRVFGIYLQGLVKSIYGLVILFQLPPKENSFDLPGHFVLRIGVGSVT